MKFKGTDPGLTILSHGTRQKTKKIYDEYGSIPNTSVEYFIDNDEYIGYERQMSFLIKDQSDLQTVFELFDGAGDLEIESGGHYRARVIDTKHEMIDKERSISRFEVKFRIAPFFWLDASDITITPPDTVTNPAYKSEPLIRINGDDDITLIINGRQTIIEGIVDYIDIDSELKIAYKGTVNEGDKLKSDFPYLDSGVNEISAVGATSIVITPRWREL